MIFTTAEFGAFFLLFFVLFHFACRSRTAKLWLITVGSLLFYASWDYRFVPLLVFTALIDFYIARGIARPGADQHRRKLLLVCSVVVNLGVLVFFKYTNFLIGTATTVLTSCGAAFTIAPLAIVLPAGISFYTFQSMSYTIDVYRDEVRARARPVEFLAGVSFFPHLVAGPIIRASTLLPQFETFPALRWDLARRGLMLIATGLLKKGVADLLSIAADSAFSHPTTLGFTGSWIGALAFAGQIYGDFSGYTDIAIGVAALLGIELPPNFDLPYLATSPSDFWKRWHISLSSWLRDYLYIPLGGNRSGRYRNLMLTMLLGGLWHGASWTFVAWGAYHGLLLVLEHSSREARQRIFRLRLPSMITRAGKVLGMFYLVTIGWVFFRASSFTDAWAFLRAMHRLDLGAGALGYETAVTLALIVVALFGGNLLARVNEIRSGRVFWPACAVVFICAILLSGPKQNFIYFQF